MMWWHYGGPYWGMMGYGPWWAGHMLAGMLMWLLFLVLAVMVMRRLFRAPRRGDDRNSALTILSERYARGEIGREEYLEKRRDLAEPAG
jgi:putative membrane protein